MGEKFSDPEILRSWHINARPWIKAIGDGGIESRLLVTNKAILDAVLKIKPRELLI